MMSSTFLSNESKDSQECNVVMQKSKLGIEIKKEDDLSTWYTQVLLKAEMMEYSDISGCYVLRPWSFKIWNCIREFLTKGFEKRGVEEAYFPLFVSQSALQKEKDHVEGFAPEVAWVTRSGSSDLPEPIAVRPTSETIMYPFYSKWIQSHRDMPLKLNQWCNVVRWEFKHPQPFLRSREFLWQEGHTAFLTKEEADAEVLDILELYKQVYEDLLAVPVIKGMKSEKEKFAGGLYTTTVEAFIPATGRGIQGATSHCLGQNFAKMFGIQVQADEGSNSINEYVWQNSWGFTTRAIGVMTLIHADNAGMVLPPRVAAVQVVIIPVGISSRIEQEISQKIYLLVEEIVNKLQKIGIRARSDTRDNYTPGWKFNHWELKGVPIRIEIGPKDIQAGEVRVVRRIDGTKQQVKLDNICDELSLMLDQIHNQMLSSARLHLENRLKIVENWEEFIKALNEKCLALAPWCETTVCEDQIKERSTNSAQAKDDSDARAPSMGAKSLCIPFDQPKKDLNVCVSCGSKAKKFALFGRSY